MDEGVDILLPARDRPVRDPWRRPRAVPRVPFGVRVGWFVAGRAGAVGQRRGDAGRKPSAEVVFRGQACGPRGGQVRRA